MANKRDYYETLGINKSASKDEIKSSYRKLAKKYHPDNKETGNEAKFKEVQEAYDILYDDNKRATYDQFGHAAFEQTGGNPGGNPFQGGFGGFGGFGGEDGIDLGDIFSSFFGGGSSRNRQHHNSGPQRGNDVVMRVKVDFMDAILGRDISISLPVDETCQKCNGTGGKYSDSVKVCPNCHGRGSVRVQRRSLFGMMETDEVCPQCGGSGKIISDKCPDCGGKGYIHRKKDITVHILAGINEGQQIRVSGMGERGANGGPNGDLYVEMVIKPHQYFKRDGNDIHLDIPVDFVDATLGIQVDCPTVYGDVSLNIPAGVQPDQILRMKGQGVKDLRTGKPGDQYVHLKIKVPVNLNKKQKELLDAFKKESKTDDSFFAKFKRSFKK